MKYAGGSARMVIAYLELDPTVGLLRIRRLIRSKPPGIDLSHIQSFPISPANRNVELTEIEVKQEKAEALRNEIKQTKIEKQLKKSKDAKERMENRHIQKTERLKSALDEKMQKAEQRRNEHLQRIKEKAKLEELKRLEVLSNNLQIMDHKKNSIKQGPEAEHSTEDNQQKMDTNAMQEAACQRRQVLEEERLKKLEELKLKEKMVEEEQAKKLQLKNEEAKRKQDHLNRIKEKQQRIEEEKKRQQNTLLEKLDQGTKRKNAQLQRVREKAAAANENAKSVAIRIQSLRNESGELDLANTVNLSTEDDIQKLTCLKTKMKKIRSEVNVLSRRVQRSAATCDDSIQLNSVVFKLNKSIFKTAGLSEEELVTTGGLYQQLINSHDIKDQKKVLEKLVDNSCFDDRIISALHMIPYKRETYLKFEYPINFLSTVATNPQYIATSKAIELIDILLLFIKDDPRAIITDTQSREFVANLMKILNRAFLATDDDSKEVTHLLISYAAASTLVGCLQGLITGIHGCYSVIQNHLSFVLECAIFLNNIITFNNKEYITGLCRFFNSNPFTQLESPTPKPDILQVFIDTNLMGLVTLLTAILLSEGGSYKSAEQVAVPVEWEELSFVILDIVMKVLRLDMKLSQTLFKTPTELYHIMLFWLHHYSTNNYSNVKMINLIIQIVGLVSFETPINTEMAQIGLPRRSLLQRLVNLPFEYFIKPELSSSLLPTLSILALEERNRMVIEEDLAISFLTVYLEKHPSPMSSNLLQQLILQ